MGIGYLGRGGFRFDEGSPRGRPAEKPAEGEESSATLAEALANDEVLRAEAIDALRTLGYTVTESGRLASILTEEQWRDLKLPRGGGFIY